MPTKRGMNQARRGALLALWTAVMAVVTFIGVLDLIGK